MAATQQQRAALYTKLADNMGHDAADTLMEQLPPDGWESMATKDDLAGLEQRLTTTFTTALGEMNNKLVEGLAETNTRITEGLAETKTRITEGLTALDIKLTEGLTALDMKLTKGLADASTERAQMIKSQARQLLVIVSTVAAASVSIWITLFVTVGG